MRAHLLLLGLLQLASLGCGDPFETSSTNLQVSVSTVGIDKDNSYDVRIGGGPSRPMQATLLVHLPPGEHDVVLEGIAPNCSVQGPDSVRATVTLDLLFRVTFQVECRGVTGAIQVAAPTSGRDYDPDGFTVYLDDVLKTRVFPGSWVVIEDVPPGPHAVRLDGFSANCDLSGSPTQTVQVQAGELTRDTASATFQAACEAITGDVELSTGTAGADPDPNGYTVILDGQLVLEPCGWYDYGCQPDTPLLLEASGSHLFEQLPPGDHTYQLGDLAPNCTVNGSNPRTVSVVIGQTSAAMFDVDCS